MPTNPYLPETIEPAYTPLGITDYISPFMSNDIQIGAAPEIRSGVSVGTDTPDVFEYLRRGAAAPATRDVQLADEQFDWERTKADRYVNSKYYQELGFDPNFDNEELYASRQTTGDVMANAFAGSFKLAGSTFVDGWKGWGRAFDALYSWDSSKIMGSPEELAELHKDQQETMNKYAIFASKASEEGIFNKQFFGNMIQQGGFMLGTLAQFVSEELLTMGASTLLSGALKATKFGMNMDRALDVAEATRKLKEQSELFTKPGFMLKTANALKKALPMVETIGKMKTMHNAGAGVAQLAYLGLGGLKRGFAEANMAFTEARMEAAGTYGDLKERMMMDYEDTHGRKPIGEDLDKIEAKVQAAAWDTFKINSAVLGVMNRIQFDNILSKFRPDRLLMSKVEKEAAESAGKKAFTVTGKVAGKTTTLPYAKSSVFGKLGATGAIAKDFGKKKAAWVATKSIGGGLMKWEGMEGVQELIQEGTNTGVQDYYYDLYKTGHADAGKSFGVGVDSQRTTQGLKTFLTGAMTGRVMSPISFGMNKLIEVGTTKAADRKAANESVKNAIKDIRTVFENPSLVLTAQTANIKAQGVASTLMEEAVKKGSKYEYENIKDSAFAKAVAAARKLNMLPSLLDNIEKYGEHFTPEEFKEAFGVDFSQEHAGNVKNYMQQVAKSVQSYADVHDKLIEKIRNTVNPELYKEGSKAHLQARFVEGVMMDAAEVIATNHHKAKRAYERMQDIHNKATATPGIGGSLATAFTTLGSIDHIKSSLTLLEQEVKALEKTPNMDSWTRASIKDKRDQIAALKSWKTYHEDFEDSEKRNQAEDHLRTYLNVENKNNTLNLITHEDIREQMTNMEDYIRLNKDAQSYTDAFNKLTSPGTFAGFFNKMKVGAEMAVDQLKYDAINNAFNSKIGFTDNFKTEVDELNAIRERMKAGTATPEDGKRHDEIIDLLAVEADKYDDSEAKREIDEIFNSESFRQKLTKAFEDLDSDRLNEEEKATLLNILRGLARKEYESRKKKPETDTITPGGTATTSDTGITTDTVNDTVSVSDPFTEPIISGVATVPMNDKAFVTEYNERVENINNIIRDAVSKQKTKEQFRKDVYAAYEQVKRTLTKVAPEDAGPLVTSLNAELSAIRDRFDLAVDSRDEKLMESGVEALMNAVPLTEASIPVLAFLNDKVDTTKVTDAVKIVEKQLNDKIAKIEDKLGLSDTQVDDALTRAQKKFEKGTVQVEQKTIDQFESSSQEIKEGLKGTNLLVDIDDRYSTSTNTSIQSGKDGNASEGQTQAIRNLHISGVLSDEELAEFNEDPTRKATSTLISRAIGRIELIQLNKAISDFNKSGKGVAPSTLEDKEAEIEKIKKEWDEEETPVRNKWKYSSDELREYELRVDRLTPYNTIRSFKTTSTKEVFERIDEGAIISVNSKAPSRYNIGENRNETTYLKKVNGALVPLEDLGPNAIKGKERAYTKDLPNVISISEVKESNVSEIIEKERERNKKLFDELKEIDAKYEAKLKKLEQKGQATQQTVTDDGGAKKALLAQYKQYWKNIEGGAEYGTLDEHIAYVSENIDALKGNNKAIFAFLELPETSIITDEQFNALSVYRRAVFDYSQAVDVITLINKFTAEETLSDDTKKELVSHLAAVEGMSKEQRLVFLDSEIANMQTYVDNNDSKNLDKEIKRLISEYPRLNKFGKINDSSNKILQGYILSRLKAKDVKEDTVLTKEQIDSLIKTPSPVPAAALAQIKERLKELKAEMLAEVGKAKGTTVEVKSDLKGLFFAEQEEEPEFIGGRQKSAADIRMESDLVEEYKPDDKGNINTAEALRTVANSEFATDAERVLAAQLAAYLPEKDQMKAFNDAKTGFYPEHNLVALNFQDIAYDETRKDPAGFPVETVIVHEVLHKLVYDAVETNAAYQRSLKSLYNLAKKEAAAKGLNFYAFSVEREGSISHLHEFVTEAFTSPAFQYFLNNITYANSNKSTWTKFLEVLRDMLNAIGLRVENSVLNEVIGLTTNMLEEDKQKRTAAAEQDKVNESFNRFESFLKEIPTHTTIEGLTELENRIKSTLPDNANRQSLLKAVKNRLKEVKVEIKRSKLTEMTPVVLSEKTYYLHVLKNGKIVLYRPTKSGYSEVPIDQKEKLVNELISTLPAQSYLPGYIVEGLREHYLSDLTSNALADKIATTLEVLPPEGKIQRRQRLQNRVPESFEEDVLQRLGNGQTIQRKSFSDNTGHEGKDLEAYNWALSSDGAALDMWVFDLKPEWNISQGDEKDYENKIADILLSNPTRNAVYDRLEEFQREPEYRGEVPADMDDQLESNFRELVADGLSKRFGVPVLPDNIESLVKLFRGEKKAEETKVVEEVSSIQPPTVTYVGTEFAPDNSAMDYKRSTGEYVGAVNNNALRSTANDIDVVQGPDGYVEKESQRFSENYSKVRNVINRLHENGNWKGLHVTMIPDNIEYRWDGSPVYPSEESLIGYISDDAGNAIIFDQQGNEVGRVPQEQIGQRKLSKAPFEQVVYFPIIERDKGFKNFDVLSAKRAEIKKGNIHIAPIDKLTPGQMNLGKKGKSGTKENWNTTQGQLKEQIKQSHVQLELRTRERTRKDAAGNIVKYEKLEPYVVVTDSNGIKEESFGTPPDTGQVSFRDSSGKTQTAVDYVVELMEVRHDMKRRMDAGEISHSDFYDMNPKLIFFITSVLWAAWEKYGLKFTITGGSDTEHHVLNKVWVKNRTDETGHDILLFKEVDGKMVPNQDGIIQFKAFINSQKINILKPGEQMPEGLFEFPYIVLQNGVKTINFVKKDYNKFILTEIGLFTYISKIPAKEDIKRYNSILEFAEPQPLIRKPVEPVLQGKPENLENPVVMNDNSTPPGTKGMSKNKRRGLGDALLYPSNNKPLYTKKCH